MYKDFHQPYENNDNLFVCKKKDGFSSVAWDLYLNFEIKINVKGYDSICSPVVEGNNISFVGQCWNNPGFDYTLVKGKFNESFTEVINIKEVVPQCKYGFSIEGLTVKEGSNEKEFHVNSEVVELPCILGVTRIVPGKNIGNCLLVTGSQYLNNFLPLTLVYHLDKKDWLGRLTVNGENIYKCCIAKNGSVYYAEKVGENFEDREIKKSTNWSILPIE